MSRDHLPRPGAPLHTIVPIGDAVPKAQENLELCLELCIDYLDAITLARVGGCSRAWRAALSSSSVRCFTSRLLDTFTPADSSPRHGRDVQTPRWQRLLAMDFAPSSHPGESPRQKYTAAWQEYVAERRKWKKLQLLLRSVTVARERRRTIRCRLDVLQYCVALPGAQAATALFSILIALRATGTVASLSWPAAFAPCWAAVACMVASVLAGEWAAQRRWSFHHPIEVHADAESAWGDTSSGCSYCTQPAPPHAYSAGRPRHRRREHMALYRLGAPQVRA